MRNYCIRLLPKVCDAKKRSSGYHRRLDPLRQPDLHVFSAPVNHVIRLSRWDSMWRHRSGFNSKASYRTERALQSWQRRGVDYRYLLTLGITPR